MLLTCISCIFLMIPFSTANRGFTIQCEGDRTTLSCMESGKTEDEVRNVLWKRDSGERVIWKYHGEKQKGGTFINRKINLNKNLSLSIDGCDPSDQGLYILCIDGKPSCEVKLFVNATNQCIKQKTSTEQSIRSPAFDTMAQEDTDKNHLPTESPLSNFYTRWVLFLTPCLAALMVLLLGVWSWKQRKETRKNKSISEPLNCEPA